jgi:hypothetical protein
MSELLTVTRTPVQITDGKNSAHVTIEAGHIEYSDSADSPAWHRPDRKVIDVSSPWVVWMRATRGPEAEIVVTLRAE